MSIMIKYKYVLENFFLNQRNIVFSDFFKNSQRFIDVIF